MGTWRIDRITAEWIAENVDSMAHGQDIPMQTCQKCGATYFEILGHSCGDYIDFETQTKVPDGWTVIKGKGRKK